jgi:hypothetical protein
MLHVPHFCDVPSEAAFAHEWLQHPNDHHVLQIYGRTVTEKRWSEQWGITFAYSGSARVARSIHESPMVSQLCDRVNALMRRFCVTPPSTRASATTVASDDTLAQASTPPTSDSASLINTQSTTDTTTDTSITNVSPRVAETNTQYAPYNACLQNWYTPDDTIGLHADNESIHVAGWPIFSLSWGGPRRFVLRPRDSKSATMHEIWLQSGDLLVMGGTCQATHKHEVPKMRKKDPVTTDRINWTIRAFQPPLS